MRNATRDEKVRFSRNRRIDFIDLISEVAVEFGQECNRSDRYIDGRVTEWRDVVQALQNIHSLKRACFTRKTFRDVPEIGKRVEMLKEYFVGRGLQLECMNSPAWYPAENEQGQWNNLLNENRKIDET